MLQHLSIKNYALIDKLEIDFSEGLTIVTGETGAGKSILLGALALLIGQRADTQVLQDKSKKCIVEGIFKINKNSVIGFFEQNDFDFELLTTIRREINPEGKSRAFINDTPVNLNQLKDLSVSLIDIHSQHETLTLNTSGFQLSVIDAYAQHNPLLADYRIKYKEYKELEGRLQQVSEEECQSKKDLDYYQFQFDELEQTQLINGEQIPLEQELEVLNNSEEIKACLLKAYTTIQAGELNLLGSLNEIKNSISRISRFNPTIAELNVRLNSVNIELKDISNELEVLESDIVFSPARLEEINERLDLIYGLQKKHQLQSVEELIILKETLGEKIYAISSLEDQIVKLKTELDHLYKKLFSIANKISENRKGVVDKIQNDITALLVQLAMPNAQFKVEHTLLEVLHTDGIDKVKFLFSANKGGDFKDLNKVASGGELSRLMLTIKSLIAQLTALPTIIFDEIDTGVSGDVADKVGSIMELMSGAMQVITITHLPQIACKGETHLFVYKEDAEKQTLTRVKKLKKEERVQEIAKMLSTGTPSAAALKNAKELLSA